MTKIEWTDQTQNPIKEAKEVDGKLVKNGNYCIPISPGCKNCYASTLNARGTRFGGNGRKFGKRAEGHPNIFLDTPMLQGWERIRKPRKIFVGSMTDWGGEWVNDWVISDMLDAMASSVATFQLLTKRPERIAHSCAAWLRQNGLGQLPANIWIGISAENQATYDERIKWLTRTLAQVRFVSLEPLLGPIKLDYINELDWIIIGGESGPNARPLELDWIRAVTRQAQFEALPLVSVFVKQLGTDWAGATDKKGGDPGEWPADLRVRMFPGDTWE